MIIFLFSVAQYLILSFICRIPAAGFYFILFAFLLDMIQISSSPLPLPFLFKGNFPFKMSVLTCGVTGFLTALLIYHKVCKLTCCEKKKIS